MTTLRARVVGIDTLKAGLKVQSAAINAAVRAGLVEAGMALQAGIQASLNEGPRSGVVYDWKVDLTATPASPNWAGYRTMPNGRTLPTVKRAKPHQASAPGEAPKTDTGHLVGSVILDTVDVAKSKVQVRAEADTAVHLEFGTRYMAPRPFMAPKAAEMADDMTAIVAAKVKAVLK